MFSKLAGTSDSATVFNWFYEWCGLATTHMYSIIYDVTQTIIVTGKIVNLQLV